MKILKLFGRLGGLVVTLSVILAAVSVISDHADKTCEKNGAYTSTLLVWEQEYPGEGNLIVLGKPIRIDLERLRGLAKQLYDCVGELVSVLPKVSEEPLTAVREAVASIHGDDTREDTQSGAEAAVSPP